jgi:hypothetical protein
VKGFFPQQVDLAKLPARIALMHIDTDLYQPTKDALHLLFDRLSPGAIVIVDDYGNVSCPGVTAAVDEYGAETGRQPIFLISGQAMLVKS